MRLLLIAALTVGTCLGTTVAMKSQAPEISAPLAWQASIGPFTGNVTALVEAESGALFALVSAEIYRSTDDGVTWIRCESQPVHRAGAVNFDSWLLSLGRRLYSSGDYGGPMYVSDDECASSRIVPPPPGTRGQHESVAVANGVLFAAYTGLPLFTSSDEGKTWISSAIPPGSEPRVATRDRAVFLVVSQRLYRSMDRGTTWTQLAPGGPSFSTLVTRGSSLYAWASGGLWRSADGGETWARVLESAVTRGPAPASRTYMWVFNPSAIDEDNRWTRFMAPVQRSGARAFLETRQRTLLAATPSGILRSTDIGENWTPAGVRGQGVQSLAAGRGRAYASVEDGSLWASADAGLTWSRLEASFTGSPRPSLWPAAFSQLLVGDATRLHGGTNRELVASDDGGATWTPSGLSTGVNALVRLGDTWFAATWAGVFRSDDLARWTECSSGLQSASVSALAATSGGDLIALADFAVYRSEDACRSWWPIAGRPPARGPDGPLARPFLVSDSTMGIVRLGDGIAQLSLSDRKWIVRAALPIITAFTRDDQGRYWLGTRAGVSRLSIEGSEWRLTPMGLEGSIRALTFAPEGYLLAGVDGRGVFRARLP